MMKRTADLSPCGLYRYSLTRTWDDWKAAAVFVMLNPSTADASVDDPTILKCVKFAKRWGHGGIIVVNLFAFRATKPADMLPATDPVGAYNDWYIRWASEYSRLMSAPIVCAWGTHGRHRDRDRQVLSILGDTARALRINKDGTPQHPLYIPDATDPVPYV